MDPIINQMINTFTSVIGFSQLSGILILIAAGFNIWSNIIYKKTYSKFYNIPEKYFELNSYKEIVLNCIVAFLAVSLLSQLFAECFYENVVSSFIIFLFMMFACIVLIYFYLKFLYYDKIKKKKQNTNTNICIRIIVTIITFITTFLVIYLVLKRPNYSMQLSLITILVILTLLEAVLLIFKLINLTKDKCLKIMNKDFVKVIFATYQVIYFTIIFVLTIMLFSSLRYSDKIIGDLDNKSNIYKAKLNECTYDNKETEENTFLSLKNNSMSKELESSNSWVLYKWVSSFDNPENVIESYFNTFSINRSEDFMKYLEKSKMKKEFFSAIRLVMLLNLTVNYFIIGLAIFGLVMCALILGIILRYKYFDPSGKKVYECIEGKNIEKQFIIAEYKDRLLVMSGKTDGNNNENLILDSSEYKFIPLTSDYKIFQERYNQVNIYGSVADEESNTTKTSDAIYEKSIFRDSSN